MSFEAPIAPEALAPLKSSEGLAYLLRHKEFWPKGFVWDYRDCTMCAMGLAYEIFDSQSPSLPSMVELFGIEDNSILYDIFIGLGTKLRMDMGYITPEHVADAIETYLKEQPNV